jgi:hypothetical protein
MSPVLTSEGSLLMYAARPRYYGEIGRGNLISLEIFRRFAEELR